MRIKRELKRKETCGSEAIPSTDCIQFLCSDEEEIDSSKEDVANVNILPSDFETLKSSSGWMNDRLINAGLSLLKQRFPNMVGLKNVVSVRTCGFSEECSENEFVQIINCFGNHIVLITNKSCKQNEVKVYDSMRTGDLCIDGKEDIKKILVNDFPDVQQQQGGSDCGLYALAFSFSLCSGTDPANLSYHLDEFRAHYLTCLKKKKITDFPHDKIMKNPGKSLLRRVKVYCTCRLPDTGDNMAQCSKCLEWFYQTCLKSEWEDDKPLPKLWYRPDCR